MLTISKSKLKAQMLQVFRQIEESGEEVVVTDHNRPVLRIQAIKQGLTVEEAFADVYGQVAFLEDPDSPTTEEWGELIP